MVKQGQEIGLQNMGPGIHAAKPDEEIRKVISKYEEYYYSGIGHGVGLDLHEEPFLGNYGTTVSYTHLYLPLLTILECIFGHF